MAARAVPMDDRHGRTVLVTIAKLTVAVSPAGQWLVLPRARPIRLSDVPHGEGPFASIRYPSDLAADKPGTDVIFVGTAYPPAAARPVTQHDVSVRVGTLHKSVRVFGPRVFQAAGIAGIAPGPPQPLSPTPLRYELAWGGADDTNPDQIEVDLRNPSGVGFAETRRRKVGAPAPRLETPRTLLDQQTEPAGFGALAAHWQARSRWAGTRDATWRRTRAPIAPADWDPRFNCCAHPDLWSEAPLTTDAPVEVLGATPEGVWRFQLPPYQPLFTCRKLGVDSEHTPHLDTFLIDGDQRRVELTWRLSVVLPRKAELLESITISALAPLPADRVATGDSPDPFAAAQPPAPASAEPNP